MASWNDIAPKELLERLESGNLDPAYILDVREDAEWEYYHLPETTHMPMRTIPERLEALGTDQEWFVLCAHGVRSVYVCQYLSEQGYGKLSNVAGGIAAVALLKGYRYD